MNANEAREAKEIAEFILVENGGYCGDTKPIYETICEALEKQIPKQIKNNAYCPTCNLITGRWNYCHHCGQALIFDK